MKKIITSAIAIAIALTSFAEGEKTITWPDNTSHTVVPVITMKVAVSNTTERAFKMGSYKGGEYMAVDYGDGNLVVTKQLKATTNAASEAVVSGIAKGDGTITIYAEKADDIWYFGTDTGTSTDAPIKSINISSLKKVQQLSIQNAAVETIDISNCDSLRVFNSYNGELTSMDFSKNAELTNIDVQSNQLTSIEISKNKKLTTLKVLYNNLTSLDVTNNPVLTEIYAHFNRISSVNFINNLTYKTVNLSNNKLENVDLPAVTTYLLVGNNKLTTLTLKSSVQNLEAQYNQLTSISIVNCTKICNISNNNLTIATLPAIPAGLNAKESTRKKYIYYPQLPINVTVSNDNSVDLSSQLSAKGMLETTATTNYSFVKEDGTELVEGTDYTINGGVATFIKSFENIHGVMTTDAFPLAKGDYAFTTIPFSVRGTTAINVVMSESKNAPAYGINGVKVSSGQKGMMIQNGKKIYNK